MVKTIALIFVAVCLTLSAAGQRKHTRLQHELESLVQKFHGTAGIYVRHLRTGEEFEVHADTLFPTASIIKIPIAIGVLNRVEKGELSLDDFLQYRDSLRSQEGEDILGSFRDGEKISLRKTMMLMLATSDNTASLWCQSLAGTGTAINEWLANAGFTHTRVNSRTPGREANRSRFGWGQTTPREIAGLVVRIHERKVVSYGASERLLRMLSNNYWDGEALAQLPPSVKVISKNGAVNASRSEVLLVYAPHGPYVFSVITKNQTDQSWTADNEGWKLLTTVSALLWEYFEPADKWQPPASVKWK